MGRGGHEVSVAGLQFEAEGSGDVLTGVVGPEPNHTHSSLNVAFESITRRDIPFDRWSDTPRSRAPIFLLDEPVIYLGTTPIGLHSVLVAVREIETGPTALGLVLWSDEVNGARLAYYWPTLHDRPHLSWSAGGDHPVESVMMWFPLPEQTAFVELIVDGAVVETVRPTSRVALLHSVPSDHETRFLDGRACDASDTRILTARP